MIIFGKKYGGTFLIHDETLFNLYNHNKWLPNNLKSLDPSCLREKGNDIDYKYRCFHDITENSNNKFIVHNDTMKNIIIKEYNHNINNIIELSLIPGGMNIFDKLTENEIKYYSKILDIDNNKLNLLLIGGINDVKLPNYCFKILDKLNNLGIDTCLYIFFNK